MTVDAIEHPVELVHCLHRFYILSEMNSTSPQYKHFLSNQEVERLPHAA